MHTQPHDHIVKSHDEEQRRLMGEILRMGEMAAAQLEAALDVVQRRDDKAAERIIANDEAIDTLEQDISHDVRRLALRGPMARDLREILAALRITAGLERIGDYAATLAKLANELVREAVAAYLARDVNRAVQVRDRDVELDAQYTGLFRQLLTYMAEDPKQITACTHLLFMAKNIERIGDHATNIAENVWFRVHGDELLPPRDKRDETNTAG